YMQSLEIPPTF
nr:immunoglobulin light chain junction region [Macaca mulatta]